MVLALKSSADYFFDSNNDSNDLREVLSFHSHHRSHYNGHHNGHHKELSLSTIAALSDNGNGDKRGIVIALNNDNDNDNEILNSVTSSIRYLISELFGNNNDNDNDDCILSLARKDVTSFYHHHYRRWNLKEVVDEITSKTYFDITNDDNDYDNGDDNDGSYNIDPKYDQLVGVSKFRSAITMMMKGGATRRTAYIGKAFAHGRQLSSFLRHVERHYPIEQLLALLLPFWVPILVPLVRIVFKRR
jgi:hypothetical protein